jgi:hypothetical protein
VASAELSLGLDIDIASIFLRYMEIPPGERPPDIWIELNLGGIRTVEGDRAGVGVWPARNLYGAKSGPGSEPGEIPHPPPTLAECNALLKSERVGRYPLSIETELETLAVWFEDWLTSDVYL